MTSIPKTSLAEAQQLLTHIKSLATCRQDFLTCKESEYGEDWAQTDVAVRRFGYRGFLSSRFATQFGLMRALRDTSIEILAKTGVQLQEPERSKLVATAQHLRMGACSELAHLTWFQRADFWLVATAPKQAEQQLTEQQQSAWQNRHAFVMCNVAAGQLFKGQNVSAISKLSDAIVIDPFFNFVCKAAELPTTGAPLVDYWRAHGQRVIVEAQCHVDFAKQRALMMSEAALIAHTCEKYRPIADQHPDLAETQKTLDKALTRYIKPKLDKALTWIAPGTAWTLKVTSDFNYDLTTKDKVTDTATALTQLGIQHKVVAGIAIALRNPNPDDLAKAFPLAVEHITGLPPLPVRLILHLASL
jgi:hypothetical protein